MTIADIGFNDAVDFDGRAYLVQTEVGAGLVARTTVLVGGAVRLSETHPLPVNVAREDIEAHVRAQHDRVVARVRAGEV